MTRCHILTEFIWPDGAPTGIYAEQVATALKQAGHEVVVVGGDGVYRPSRRKPPDVHQVKLKHYRGSRGNLISTALCYLSVTWAFHRYIREHVAEKDIVIVTTAPPLTIHLAPVIKKRKAIGIYWLQDYYPELLRGVGLPGSIAGLLSLWWKAQLRQWHQVVKIGSNLAYQEKNSQIIRNWPTLKFNAEVEVIRGMALYVGNLGYGHCLSEFTKTCRELQKDGFSIIVRGDGPGMYRLPEEFDCAPGPASEEELVSLLQSADIHLIAGHPDIPGAIFPSKYWNARATGRDIVATGFAGAMDRELKLAAKQELDEPLRQWIDLVKDWTPPAPPSGA